MALVSNDISEYNLSNLGEFDIEYKYTSDLKNRPVVKSSKDAYAIVMQLYDMKKIGLQEQIVVLYLSNSNTVLGCCNLSKGAINGVLFDIRHVLASALKLMASGVILSHNHPSGKMKASEQDKQVTNRLKIALEHCDIKLLDHIIVSPFDEFISFQDEGIF